MSLSGLRKETKKEISCRQCISLDVWEKVWVNFKRVGGNLKLSRVFKLTQDVVFPHKQVGTEA